MEDLSNRVIDLEKKIADLAEELRDMHEAAYAQTQWDDKVQKKIVEMRSELKTFADSDKEYTKADLWDMINYIEESLCDIDWEYQADQAGSRD